MAFSIDRQHATTLMSDVAYPANIHQEVLKQLPHMVGGINLLHLHLCVHIAVVQEVDVGDLHLTEWKKKDDGQRGCIIPSLCYLTNYYASLIYVYYV